MLLCKFVPIITIRKVDNKDQPKRPKIIQTLINNKFTCKMMNHLGSASKEKPV